MFRGKFVNKTYSYTEVADVLSRKDDKLIMGAGVTSIVYRLTGNRVMKLGHCGPYDIITSIQTPTDFADDPYLNFIKMIDGSANRYFPKVYEVNLFEDKRDGQCFYTVMTELLHPLRYDCVEMLKQYRDIACEALCFRKYPLGDAQLIMALNTLWKLQERFTDDIHPDNVMFRGVEHPSLVFIDPVC
jgi:hypothetical protein